VTRRRPFAAAAAVAVFVVGQLVALSHEAATRHVTCAEHGEQLEAAKLAGQDDNCGRSHLIGVDGETGGHQDCDIARLLRTSTRTSSTIHIQIATTSVATVHTFASFERPAALDVIRIAPKTSPPV
jgi:hypothetical protein